jgi:uncharacterized PurR-regulated membrane protein YhhQ (DUF165 family)
LFIPSTIGIQYMQLIYKININIINLFILYIIVNQLLNKKYARPLTP